MWHDDVLSSVIYTNVNLGSPLGEYSSRKAQEPSEVLSESDFEKKRVY